jgi:hypothetical protein
MVRRRTHIVKIEVDRLSDACGVGQGHRERDVALERWHRIGGGAGENRASGVGIRLLRRPLGRRRAGGQGAFRNVQGLKAGLPEEGLKLAQAGCERFGVGLLLGLRYVGRAGLCR